MTTYKELKNKIKEEQKIRAQKITRGKFLRKPSNRTSPTPTDIQDYYWSGYGCKPEFSISKVNNYSETYRTLHIAYCMFFNKTPYEKIETNPSSPPLMVLAESYIKEWSKEIETVHNNS